MKFKLKIEKSSYPLGEGDDAEEVAKVIIVSPDKEVLLLRRADHMIWEPNKWDLPGGHRKENEEIKDAARREVKEELGIDIEDLSKVDEFDKITLYRTSKEKEEDYKLDDENQEAKWINISALNNIELVPKIEKYIRKVLV